MENQIKISPFAPGTGFVPPLLAGREAETKLLVDALSQLLGPCVKGGSRLANGPPPPIRICGPRGVGKTALLNWTKRRAAKENIRAVHWSRLKERGRYGTSLEDLMCRLAGTEERILATISRLGVTLLEPDGRVAPAERAERGYGKIMREVLAAEPLLLVMDEVHHYDAGPLATLLRKNQELMDEGLPLAMVLAGTPGLNRHLRGAVPDFLGRSEGLHINLLSDEAARDAMRVPFEQEGVAVAPAALEAMAAQADNYPYFTQLVGEAVWEAMEEAGRNDVDAGLAAAAAAAAREQQDGLHERSCAMLARNGLLTHACRVVDRLDGGGGAVDVKAVKELLAKSSAANGGDAEEIYDGMRLDGLIWTVDGVTRTGRPSLFSYFKARHYRR